MFRICSVLFGSKKANSLGETPPFHQVRHREPVDLPRSRDLVVALAPMTSNVNLSAVARSASFFKVPLLITTGPVHKFIEKVAREAQQSLKVEHHNSLSTVLPKLKSQGYRVVALEQADKSKVIYDYNFPEKTVLVLGNERSGLKDDVMALADAVIEIPVYQLPHSLNVASAASIAIYEYCKQHRLENSKSFKRRKSSALAAAGDCLKESPPS